ncbi:MAG: N-acetylmuramoyl-L-alanine amidase [Oscillospiraceae bacterium]|nr:N-acetylmuramoyl-L-alanine amidase [Oscillospiraceae bacterium]
MSKTVFIDPGHGGRDPGAVNGTRFEKDDNLAFAMAVKKKLAAQGISTTMARETDIDISLSARCGMANAQNADMLVSIHRNMFTSTAANGVEIWVYTNPTAQETAAAQKMMKELADVGIQSNRGVKRGNYHVLRESKMPAVMIEPGFLSNARDNELFDTKLDDYAQAITKGICGALGIPLTEPAGELFRVQVGAFKNRDNAENFLRTVQASWPEAFIAKS